MHRIFAFLAALWVCRGHGQVLVSVAGSVGDTTLTSNCGSTFGQANATGNFQINPDIQSFDTSSGYANPVELGVTVLEGSRNTSNSVQISIWYATGGANYSDDLSLGYDVCAFTFLTYSDNTLLRAQADTGNCLATFDSECVSDLESAASGYADGLISNATPSPNSNLTAGSLPTVCYEIAQSIENNFPSSCGKFMNSSETLTVGGFPLTSNTKSPLDNGCNLTSDENNDAYHLLYTQNTLVPAGQQEVYYSAFTFTTLPAVLTFMPVANIKAKLSISESSSKMTCMRANHVNPGSKKPLTPPAPKPLGSGGLSGGAIAGIVVGVVVGVALVAGAAFWFWRRRRAQRKEATTTEAPAMTQDHPPAYGDAKEAQTPMAEALTDTGIKELSPDNEVRPELAGAYKPEIKRGNTGDPVELSAEISNTTGGRS